MKFIKNRGHNTMALGGRPKEEGGHKRVKHSLDIKTIKLIEKFAQTRPRKYKSGVVEEGIALLEQVKDPEKKRRSIQLFVKKQFNSIDSLRKRHRKPFFAHFNECIRDEAIALWLFDAIDELLHCFKVAWNIKDKAENHSAVDYLEEYLEGELQRHVDYLREGFLWIAKNGDSALFKYLKELYCDTHSLYVNIMRISDIHSRIDNGRAEYPDQVERLFSEEAGKRGYKPSK